MDVERGVQHRRAAAQVEDLAVAQEDEDALPQHLLADRLDELARAVDLVLPVLDGVEPRHRVGLGDAAAAVAGLVVVEVLDAEEAVLVEPVGGHAVLRDLVHPGRADLDLDDLVLGLAAERRVERLVAVGLREGDVVLDARHGLAALELLHEAEHVVAEPGGPLAPGLQGLGRAVARHLEDDAERDDVGHAVQILVVEHVGRVRRVLELEGAKGRAVAALAPRAPEPARGRDGRDRRRAAARREDLGREHRAPLLDGALHLQPEAVELLRAAADAHLDAPQLRVRREARFQGLAAALERGLVAGPPHLERGLERRVGPRVGVAERPVLELGLERPQAQAVRERREDLERLARDAQLLVPRHVF